MAQSVTVQAPKRLFSVEEYHRLAEAGILQENDRVELIHGEIIKMSPIGPKHAGNLDRFVRIFTFLFGESAIVRSQNPVQLNDFSEPEPDISILKPRRDFYTTAHPKAEEVILIIELADSSLEYDKEVKMPEYASNNIPEYWIIDLKTDRVIVYAEPSGQEYLNIKTFQVNEQVESRTLPKPVSVRELLG
ncbi:MAG: Uma2 family endonuclease [Phaeodactylibacter sp.]|nr:Uma2 family endonuclease [Phaeodactylibacter sp.]MCB9293500.1 Uma2 family endonuclease [Lewinellaceae bacterium]